MYQSGTMGLKTVAISKKPLPQAVQEVLSFLPTFSLKGKTVLVKPNANTSDAYPGSTDPLFLDAVLKTLKGYGPKDIIVGEKSMTTLDTTEVMKEIGMYAVIKENHLDFIDFDSCDWMPFFQKEMKTWSHGISLPDILRKVDVIITLPICKTHWTALFTMALKGQVGFTADEDRRRLPHGLEKDWLFGQMIAEISLGVKANYTIMDARTSFVTDGPNIGKKKSAGIIVASDDMVANDVIGLAILKMLGSTEKIMSCPVWRQPQIVHAIRLGLGAKNDEDVVIKGTCPEIQTIQDHLKQ